MWIILIEKLATEVSPPKLSIFWSQPWPSLKQTNHQVDYFLNYEMEDGFDRDDHGEEMTKSQLRAKAEAYLATQKFGVGPGNLFGNEPNWVGARKIHYKDTDLRVFPHEFNVLSQENMAMYIGLDGESASHELVTGSVAETMMMDNVLKGQAKEVYDAAMVDGCTDVQAMAMALGVDVSIENQAANFPALGWYRCRPEYAQIYCYEEEMTE